MARQWKQSSDFYNPGGTSGAVIVALYSSTNNSSTANLGILGVATTASVTFGSFQVIDFFSFAPIALTANTRYYILVGTASSPSISSSSPNLPASVSPTNTTSPTERRLPTPASVAPTRCR